MLHLLHPNLNLLKVLVFLNTPALGLISHNVSYRALQHPTPFSAHARSRRGLLSTSRTTSIHSNTAKSWKPITLVRRNPFYTVYGCIDCTFYFPAQRRSGLTAASVTYSCFLRHPTILHSNLHTWHLPARLLCRLPHTRRNRRLPVVMSMHHIHMLIPDKFVYFLIFPSHDSHSDPCSQPMMPGMPPPGPPGAYMPGPYMQAMHYPPGMPPPNGQGEFPFRSSLHIS